MKRIFLAVLTVSIVGFTACLIFIPGVRAQILDFLNGDPDMPDFASFKTDKEEFMLRRAEGVSLLRGIEKDKELDPQLRIDAVAQMAEQEAAWARSRPSAVPDAAWTELGPNPIPNAQVETLPVTTGSGRVTAIAVDPTNANIVYVGVAQGGLYRSTDGGTNWTRMLDNGLSLAIGAIAVAPSQPGTVYIGTGEPNFSQDSFFGVGLYRIDNASSASPTVTGPIGGAQFNGRSIGEIIIHPTVPATIFVASTSGVGGIGPTAPTILPNRGVYRSTDATSAAPVFTQLAYPFANQNLSARDIAIDPDNPNVLIANVVANGGGIIRSANALAASPTFTLVQTFSSTNTSELTAEFAAFQPAAAADATFYAATGNLGGRVLRSVDGGLTWTQQIDNNFCTGQCFYDIAIDVDPTNGNNVYLGGSPNLVFGRSADSGVTFTADGVNFTAGLHVDTHVIAVAPSNPAVVYLGTDGGIYRTANVSATPIVWTSLNNSQFTATQFMGLDVHPTDPNFTIGGTQDNGTNFLRPDGTWFRADFGDGGYAVIDQNAANTTTVTMYHTYFNQFNAMGYGRVLTTANAQDNLWQGFGCGFGGFIANGMTCAATAILFYAPMERGPGNPSTLYFGSDVLYRSANSDVTMTKVSQEPITANVAISSIGIAPGNDNVRIVGLANGGVFGTGTTPGTTTLQNLDPVGVGSVIPDAFVARTVIDPNNVNTAYVTLSAFGVANVWKTTTLSSFADGLAPTWTAATGTGANVLPQVPVSGFAIDPINSNILYAGTDIGVYVSPNGGTNWFPFGTGLPRVAVFDIAITNAAPRQVRIATHGRGLWQVPALAPTAANVSVSGRVLSPGGSQVPRATVLLTDQSGASRSVTTNSFGYFRFEEVVSGQTYVVSVTSKQYQFDAITIAVSDQIDDLTITANDGFGK